MELLEALASRILVADGAMGTLLRARGAGRGSCLEELCLIRPELIEQVHREYLAAGAQLIRTHSFGSNAARLEHWGLADRVEELNWTAARIAHDAAHGTEAIVAASVGPTGVGCEAEALFEKQLSALLEGGVQCVIFETFTDADELILALEVAHSLQAGPTVAMLAHGAPEAWTRLRDAGADVVGVNCVGSPAETLATLGRAHLGGTAVFPSAGLPDARGAYALTPECFAADAGALVERGVRLIGGCCGTTPAHIAALTARLSAAA